MSEDTAEIAAQILKESEEMRKKCTAIPIGGGRSDYKAGKHAVVCTYHPNGSIERNEWFLDAQAEAEYRAEQAARLYKEIMVL